MKTSALLKFRFLLGIATLFLPLVAAAATKIVTVADNSFSPSSLTIQVGDTVEWRNAAGGHDHNVTANNGAFQSETASQFTFDVTFNTAGTVNYHCTIHSSMKGSITVQGGSSGAADLAVQSVDAQNGTYAPGASIPIDISIQNVGTATSAAFTVSFYASTDSKCCGGSDTKIGSSNRSALAANQTSNFTVNAALPASIANGSYFIGATIEISDSNSANNTGVDTTPVTVKTADSFVINNGLNDTWRDIGTRGQGFFITVFPDIQKMFVGWFTYDVERPAQGVTAVLGEPGHRWVTAFGSYSGHTATLDIEFTQGGVFNSGDPAPTQGPYGTMTVEFANCSEGEVTYNIPSVGVAGSVPITRVANDNVAQCEAFASPVLPPPPY